VSLLDDSGDDFALAACQAEARRSRCERRLELRVCGIDRFGERLSLEVRLKPNATDF
jgi:hypothetical protein